VNCGHDLEHGRRSTSLPKYGGHLNPRACPFATRLPPQSGETVAETSNLRRTASRCQRFSHRRSFAITLHTLDPAREGLFRAHRQPSRHVRETCASTPERRDLKSRCRRSTQSDLTVLEQSHEHRQIDRQSSSNPVALEIRCLTIVLSTQCRERSFSHRCRALTRRVAAVSLVDRHPQCDGLVHGGHWSNLLAISLIRALRSSGDFRWLSPQHLRPEGRRPCVPTSDVREGVCASLGRFPDRSPNL